MKAVAPGKLVLSGAYSVLRGAPALVTAVDRVVVANDALPCRFETPEVQAALEMLADPGPHPDFDPEQLRSGDRKLGLGSSAAILAASLALLWWKRHSSALPPGKAPLQAELARELFPVALLAHQRAQGGGSGLDVAAACFGGTLAARVEPPTAEGELPLTVRAAPLPPGLVIETWSFPRAASTAQFVRAVLALETQDSAVFSARIAAQGEASETAADAAVRGDVPGMIASLRAQFEALSALGKDAGVPIVLDEVRQLHDALPASACFLPSGAGGGDVTLHVATTASSPTFRKAAQEHGFELVPLTLGARGVHFVSENSSQQS